MGQYLDSVEPFESYRGIAGTRFFVDKTLLLEDIFENAYGACISLIYGGLS